MINPNYKRMPVPAGAGWAQPIDQTPGGITEVFLNEDDTGELNEDATFSLPEG